MNSKQKREDLKSLSNILRPIAKESNLTINAALVQHYAEICNTTPQDFKTFENWKSEGYAVKKGAKGFPIWGQAIEVNFEAINENGDVLPQQCEKVKIYKMVYLYANSQVVKTLKSN